MPSESRERFLLELNDHLRNLADPEQVQYEAARAVGEFLNADRVGYAEAQPDADTIAVTRNYVNGVPGIEGHYRYADYGADLLTSLEAGVTVVRPDIQNHPTLTDAEKAAHAALEVGATVNVPLRKDDRLIAVLFMHQRRPRAWTVDELELLEAVADRTWSAVVRARAEESARTSEARLQLALDIAGIGTWHWDLVKNTGGLDERGAKIVGLEQGDLGNVVQAQLDRIHPDDLAATQAVISDGVARGGSFELSYRVIHPDGQVRHVASLARVVSEGGRPVSLVGTNRDVTVEKEAEARVKASESRYHAIVEQGPALLAVMEGPDQVFSLVSPSYELFAGRGRLVGRAFCDVAPEMRGSQFDLAHRRVYETGEPVSLIEQQVPGDRYFTVHYTALPDEQGKVYAISSLAFDVTDHVRARKEAEEARRVAEAANRAKSEFLAVMSHELRTPLNAIGGYAELMEMGIRGPVTEEMREDLRRVQQSQRHLLGLINEVLNYTRVAAGAVQYDITEVRVSEAVHAAEALIAPQARARGLNYEFEAVGEDVLIRADREKVQQILLNILSNAIKFTERGGTLAMACAESGKYIELSISDSGVGIAREKLLTIFEPFVQVNQGLTRPHEGVGLGLAISRDLARGMGGDLVADSVPGEGSAFTLRLPRA